MPLMLHLIAFQNNHAARGIWLLIGVCGPVPNPGEHGLCGDPEQEHDTVHSHTTEVPQDGRDLHHKWLAARSCAGKLITTLLAWLLWLTRRRAIVNDAITLPFGACMPQRSPPAGVALQSARGRAQSSDGNTTTTWLKPSLFVRQRIVSPYVCRQDRS